MIYSRYERFWHWSQAALDLHPGFHRLFRPRACSDGLRLAAQIHSYAAIALIVLWVFTTFWHFTTGQWRQYLPKLSSLPAILKFYAWGILAGAPHPYTKTLKRKQNALQSLAYLWFMVIIGPALWSTGIVYLTYPWWAKLAAGNDRPAGRRLHPHRGRLSDQHFRHHPHLHDHDRQDAAALRQDDDLRL